MVARKSQKSGSEQSPPAAPRESAIPARPEVIIEFLFDRGLFFISVSNIGDQPALNVSVKFDKKIMGLEGRRDISALALFRNIEFLGPRREIVALLDSSSSYFSRKQPTKISALVTYRDLDKRSYEVTIKHDLEIYRELAFVMPTRDKSDDERGNTA